MPTSSTTNSLVINFNKNISQSDLSDAVLKISTTQGGSDTNCTFDDGIVTKRTGTTVGSVGNYTISGSTLTISFTSSNNWYAYSFALTGASLIGQ